MESFEDFPKRRSSFFPNEFPESGAVGTYLFRHSLMSDQVRASCRAAEVDVHFDKP